MPTRLFFFGRVASNVLLFLPSRCASKVPLSWDENWPVSTAAPSHGSSVAPHAAFFSCRAQTDSQDPNAAGREATYDATVAAACVRPNRIYVH